MSTKNSDTDWGSLTVAELKEELRSRGLSVTGRKSDLVQRLKQNDEGQSVAEGNAATSDFSFDKSPEKMLKPEGRHIKKTPKKENDCQSLLSDKLEVPKLCIKTLARLENSGSEDKNVLKVIRRRRRFSVEERHLLKHHYDLSSSPSKDVVTRLAHEFKVSKMQIKVWFTNEKKKFQTSPAPVSKQGCGTEYPMNKYPKKSIQRKLFTSASNKHKYTSIVNSKLSQKRLFTKEEKTLLNEYYEHTPKPGKNDIRGLAKQLRVTFVRIQNWFYQKDARIRVKLETSDYRKNRLFTSSEQYMLTSYFYRSQNPSSEELVALAEDFNVPVHRIKSWFNNKRVRSSKRHAKDFNMFNADAGYSGIVDSTPSVMLDTANQPDFESIIRAAAVLNTENSKAAAATTKYDETNTIKNKTDYIPLPEEQVILPKHDEPLPMQEHVTSTFTFHTKVKLEESSPSLGKDTAEKYAESSYAQSSSLADVKYAESSNAQSSSLADVKYAESSNAQSSSLADVKYAESSNTQSSSLADVKYAESSNAQSSSLADVKYAVSLPSSSSVVKHVELLPQADDESHETQSIGDSDSEVTSLPDLGEDDSSDAGDSDEENLDSALPVKTFNRNSPLKTHSQTVAEDSDVGEVEEYTTPVVYMDYANTSVQPVDMARDESMEEDQMGINFATDPPTIDRNQCPETETQVVNMECASKQNINTKNASNQNNSQIAISATVIKSEPCEDVNKDSMSLKIVQISSGFEESPNFDNTDCVQNCNVENVDIQSNLDQLCNDNKDVPCQSNDLDKEETQNQKSCDPETLSSDIKSRPCKQEDCINEVEDDIKANTLDVKINSVYSNIKGSDEIPKEAEIFSSSSNNEQEKAESKVVKDLESSKPDGKGSNKDLSAGKKSNEIKEKEEIHMKTRILHQHLPKDIKKKTSLSCLQTIFKTNELEKYKWLHHMWSLIEEYMHTNNFDLMTYYMQAKKKKWTPKKLDPNHPVSMWWSQNMDKNILEASGDTPNPPLETRMEALMEGMKPEMKGDLLWCHIPKIKKSKITIGNVRKIMSKGILGRYKWLNHTWQLILEYVDNMNTNCLSYYKQVVKTGKLIPKHHPALMWWSQNMSKRVLERGTKLEGNAVSVDEPSTAAAKAKDQSPLDVQLGTNTTNTDNMVQTLIEVEADSDLKNTATEEKVQPALDMEECSRGNSISVINSSPITSSVGSSNLININLTPSKLDETMLEDGELFINENITQEVRAQFSIKEKSQLLFSHYNATAQEQTSINDIVAAFSSGSLKQHNNPWITLKHFLRRCMELGVSMKTYFKTIVELKQDVPEDHPVKKCYNSTFDLTELRALVEDYDVKNLLFNVYKLQACHVVDLYIGGLPNTLSRAAIEKGLMDLFAPYNAVGVTKTYIKTVNPKQNFAFVKFTNLLDAAKAKQDVDGFIHKVFGDCPLTVKYATKQSSDVVIKQPPDQADNEAPFEIKGTEEVDNTVKADNTPDIAELPIPPNKLYRWLIDNFTLNKTMRMLYLTPLTSVEFKNPELLHWIGRASKFSINNWLQGEGVGILQFQTDSDCCNAKMSLLKALNVRVIIPTKEERETVRKIVPFKVVDEALELRVLVFEVPIGKVESDVQELVPNAQTISSNVFRAQNNWSEQKLYVPEDLMNVFLVEYDTVDSASEACDREYEIDGNKVDVSRLVDFHRNYSHDFWEQLMDFFTRKEKEKKQKNVLLTDKWRADKCKKLAQTFNAAEQLIVSRVSGQFHINQHELIQNMLHAKGLKQVINLDTNRRCLTGELFPEDADYMTAYTLRIHKLRQEKQTLILASEELESFQHDEDTSESVGRSSRLSSESHDLHSNCDETETPTMIHCKSEESANNLSTMKPLEIVECSPTVVSSVFGSPVLTLDQPFSAVPNTNNKSPVQQKKIDFDNQVLGGDTLQSEGLDKPPRLDSVERTSNEVTTTEKEGNESVKLKSKSETQEEFAMPNYTVKAEAFENPPIENSEMVTSNADGLSEILPVGTSTHLPSSSDTLPKLDVTNDAIADNKSQLSVFKTDFDSIEHKPSIIIVTPMEEGDGSHLKETSTVFDHKVSTVSSTTVDVPESRIVGELVLTTTVISADSTTGDLVSTSGVEQLDMDVDTCSSSIVKSESLVESSTEKSSKDANKPLSTTGIKTEKDDGSVIKGTKAITVEAGELDQDAGKDNREIAQNQEQQQPQQQQPPADGLQVKTEKIESEEELEDGELEEGELVDDDEDEDEEVQPPVKTPEVYTAIPTIPIRPQTSHRTGGKTISMSSSKQKVMYQSNFKPQTMTKLPVVYDSSSKHHQVKRFENKPGPPRHSRNSKAKNCVDLDYEEGEGSKKKQHNKKSRTNDKRLRPAESYVDYDNPCEEDNSKKGKKKSPLDEKLSEIRKNWQKGGSVYIQLSNYYTLEKAKKILGEYGAIRNILNHDGDIYVKFEEVESATNAMYILWKSRYQPQIVMGKELMIKRIEDRERQKLYQRFEDKANKPKSTDNVSPNEIKIKTEPPDSNSRHRYSKDDPRKDKSRKSEKVSKTKLMDEIKSLEAITQKTVSELDKSLGLKEGLDGKTAKRPSKVETAETIKQLKEQVEQIMSKRAEQSKIKITPKVVNEQLSVEAKYKFERLKEKEENLVSHTDKMQSVISENDKKIKELNARLDAARKGSLRKNTSEVKHLASNPMTNLIKLDHLALPLVLGRRDKRSNSTSSITESSEAKKQKLSEEFREELSPDIDLDPYEVIKRPGLGDSTENEGFEVQKKIPAQKVSPPRDPRRKPEKIVSTAIQQEEITDLMQESTKTSAVASVLKDMTKEIGSRVELLSYIDETGSEAASKLSWFLKSIESIQQKVEACSDITSENSINSGSTSTHSTPIDSYAGGNLHEYMNNPSELSIPPRTITPDEGSLMHSTHSNYQLQSDFQQQQQQQQSYNSIQQQPYFPAVDQQSVNYTGMVEYPRSLYQASYNQTALGATSTASHQSNMYSTETATGFVNSQPAISNIHAAQAANINPLSASGFVNPQPAIPNIHPATNIDVNIPNYSGYINQPAAVYSGSNMNYSLGNPDRNSPLLNNIAYQQAALRSSTTELDDNIQSLSRQVIEELFSSDSEDSEDESDDYGDSRQRGFRSTGNRGNRHRNRGRWKK